MNNNMIAGACSVLAHIPSQNEARVLLPIAEVEEAMCYSSKIFDAAFTEQ